ncbi:flavin containing amine oxidoreductase [Aureococcus anophagefferens]|nr:flavin containing amine oxidoreductase [Aureococcus anophagefferens]
MKTSNPTGGKKNLFVANNDYWFAAPGHARCWAEQSAKVAEPSADPLRPPKARLARRAYYRDQVSAL